MEFREIRRDQLGLTAAQLAEKIDVAPRTIYGIEAKNDVPKVYEMALKRLQDECTE
jgi:DNA-binding XRE family transcriptional regulator